MADSFADQLRTELDSMEAELARLAARRRLIEELLNLQSASVAPVAAAKPKGRRSVRRPARTVQRQPRGLVTGKVREFLGQQGEPAHATRILAYLEQHDAAPRSAKPMATLQSTLQRLKETGEIENTGRNHWRLRSPEPELAPPSPPVSGSAPAVVTSTTRFGSTPTADR